MKTLGVLTYWNKKDDGDSDEIERAVGVKETEEEEIIITVTDVVQRTRVRRPDYFGNAGHASDDIGVLSYCKKDSNGDYDDIKIGVFVDQSDESAIIVAPTDIIISTKHRLASDIAPSVNVNVEMAKYEDLPMAGIPMPEGWKGDSPENPNFKALGKLSPPIMRKIEPSGPAFIAFSRRKLKGRTFSEDDRIEALSKVKKIEDNDDGEISEPEDPMMLQRDAKDWKVRYTAITYMTTH